MQTHKKIVWQINRKSVKIVSSGAREEMALNNGCKKSVPISFLLLI